MPECLCGREASTSGHGGGLGGAEVTASWRLWRLAVIGEDWTRAPTTRRSLHFGAIDTRPV
jgi:hypothetical protein